MRWVWRWATRRSHRFGRSLKRKRPGPRPGDCRIPTPLLAGNPDPGREPLLVNRPGVPGRRVQFRWAHGFFGNPETPFPPHEALDGRRFDSLADVPYGLYPGDHAGCRCAFLPEIKVV